MALVTISGFPSSGKTRRAQQIRASLEQYLRDENYEGSISKVSVLSDDALNVSRSSYDESRSEKAARGALFTAMQRQMALDTILIVDALNYIKGFRYQMYCAAREMKLRICTVYVVATQEQCREWNKTRQDGLAYAPETSVLRLSHLGLAVDDQESLDNLLFRYEEPSSMVRWDSPLFTVLWDEDAPPMPQIWDAITKGNIKPPNSGTLSVAKAPTDALQALEQTTAAIVSAILADQTGFGGQLKLLISTPSLTFKPTIVLPPRNITLSELQRLKRQFVTVHKKAITLGTTEKGTVNWGEESITSKFVMYLEEHMKS